jgi:hypothetical protein
MIDARLGPSGLVVVQLPVGQAYLGPDQARTLADQLAAALAEVDEDD